MSSGSWMRALCGTWIGVLWAATRCCAGELTVNVVDVSGHGVGEVVVTVSSPQAHAAPPAGSSVMDQRQLEFAPRVLVVGVGTRVDFPNNDTVSHQVYSFSAAKKFQLPLYKGQIHPPVTFGEPGLVVLGCNIHDQMVGYIVVTDVAFFGKTDSTGAVHLSGLPAGDYGVTIWSPYIAEAPSGLTRAVHLGHDSAESRIQLTRALRALPEPRPRRADWEY